MKSKSGSFVYDDAFKSAHRWDTGHWHHIGDRVKWFGMLLRCQVDHYAGDAAQHPWDPGWGWGDGAAAMWRVLTPDFLSSESDEAHARASTLALAASVPARDNQ